MAGKIIVPILSAFSAKGVNEANSAITKLGASMKEIGAGLGSSIGVAAGGFSMGNILNEAITQAGLLESGMIAVNTVFGDYADKVTGFIENSNKVGISQVEAARSITFLGSVLKQAGFDMDTVAAQSKNLTTMGADLAATYGYSVQESLVAITAMFRGEYDPIEKFGVAMKQAEVNAIIAAKGLDHLTGQALLNEQMIARMELFYNRAKDAMGAFGKQADNIRPQMAKLSGAFMDALAAFGKPLITPMAHFIKYFRQTMPQILKSWQPFFDIIGRTMEVFAPMGQIIGEIVAMVGDIMTPIADLLYYVASTIAPIFYGLWAILQPIFDIIIKGLGALGTIVKMILMPVKLVAILVGLLMQKLGELFDWMFGPGGDMFQWFTDTFGKGVDDIDAKLNELMMQIYGFKLESEEWDWNFDMKLNLDPPKPEGTDNGLADWIKAIREALKNVFPTTFVMRELGKFESAVVESFKKITDLVQEGLDKNFITKTAAKAFTDYANTVKTELAQIGRERDSLLKKYSLGKALIADTKAAVIGFANLANILSDSGAEITKTVSYMSGKIRITLTETVKGVSSATDIIGKFRDILNKTKDFAKNLEALRAMNISSALYQQILSGGIEQGAAVADALVQGGQSAVNELNGLFNELATTGAGMGEEAAQVMYGAGLDLSKGLIEGILQADSELVKAAKTLAKSFKTAFMDGIVGVAGTNKSFLAPLVDMMFGEAAIGSAYDNPGSSTNINVTVNAGVGTDGVAVGRSIVKVLKDYERINGTSWRAGIA